MNNKSGGKNTNKNGLNFENDTLLEDEQINNFVKIKKNKLRITMKNINEKNLSIKEGHGCKEPDEVYIDKTNKKLLLLEKKFQNCSGSVCEKLQTCIFKKKNFEKQYPNFSIIYVYILSSWFLDNCIAELDYLEENNIKYFIGNKINYKNLIKEFIENI